MVNPVYRLMLGMIVLLSGVGFRSAQAQYGRAASPVSPGAVFSQAGYHPGNQAPMNYEQGPVDYQTVNQYQSDYYGGADQSEMISRALPVDRGWAYDHPMDGLFKNLAQNSWMRLEYLLWKAPPGNQLIGTETTSGNDPRNSYTFTDADGRLFSTKEADLNSIGANGANGIRGTFGIDFNGGTFETVFFGMKSDSSSVSYEPNDLLGPTFGQTDMISIQTFLDGQLAASTGRNFNQTFSATYQTQAWGVESNYVINTESLFFRTYYGAGGLQIRPLVGFRYLKIGEEMNIRGSFEDLTLTVPVSLFESTVNSTTNNKLYVPQAGIRMEFVHPWFTISAQPKVGFGINNYEGSVLTDQFLDATDPTHVTHISKRRFSPTFEFGLNARFHLSENFTFNVGYNFLWASQIARPDSIIYYNTSSANPTTGVSLQAQNSLDSYKLHGLVIGGEIRLP
ncbi:BBP7 family outer membrane beta-barrel protein [uncultured Gimesia sp.]|uniref:BBP7 family outer membrane beta-barrel protein n=1 Tax=uncultured Gimesia sp. TaxID=1678688 RepID=UPI0030D9F773